MNIKALSKLLVVIAPFLLLISCSKQNNDIGNDYYDQCVELYDKTSGAPLHGASVTLTLTAPVNGQIDFPGTTDVNGKSCINLPNSGTIASYEAGSLYYTTVGGTGPPPAVLQLTAEARLTLYIYNYAPTDAGDMLVISYNHPSLGDSIIKIFNGASVDTSMSLYITPGMNTLKWSSTHLGVTTDSTYGPVNMYANNTVRSIVY